MMSFIAEILVKDGVIEHYPNIARYLRQLATHPAYQKPINSKRNTLSLRVIINIARHKLMRCDLSILADFSPIRSTID